MTSYFNKNILVTIAQLPLKILALIKGLPFIKDIPGFNTIPSAVNTANLRFYKLGNLVYTLGMAMHGAWITLFFLLDIMPMVYLNIFSFLIYIFNIIINRQGHQFLSATIMIAEIIFHQAIAVNWLGLGAGFQYYIMVIMLLPFLMPKGKWGLKLVLLAACISSYLYLDFSFKNSTPEFILDPLFLSWFNISNIVFAFTSMAISGSYFNLAMHETEAALEQKTQELVESEQKATLGKLATEMAHEIQNPLNFVNNFAGINGELLLELKEALASENKNEAEELLNDLISNSTKIAGNGKRVSEIVKMLQVQANGNK